MGAEYMGKVDRDRNGRIERNEAQHYLMNSYFEADGNKNGHVDVHEAAHFWLARDATEAAKLFTAKNNHEPKSEQAEDKGPVQQMSGEKEPQIEHAKDEEHANRITEEKEEPKREHAKDEEHGKHAKDEEPLKRTEQKDKPKKEHAKDEGHAN